MSFDVAADTSPADSVQSRFALAKRGHPSEGPLANYIASLLLWLFWGGILKGATVGYRDGSPLCACRQLRGKGMGVLTASNRLTHNSRHAGAGFYLLSPNESFHARFRLAPLFVLLFLFLANRAPPFSFFIHLGLLPLTRLLPATAASAALLLLLNALRHLITPCFVRGITLRLNQTFHRYSVCTVANFIQCFRRHAAFAASRRPPLSGPG